MDIYGRETGGIDSGAAKQRRLPDCVSVLVCAGCACYAPQIDVVRAGEREGFDLSCVEQGMQEHELGRLLGGRHALPVVFEQYDCDSCRDRYDDEERGAGY